VANYRLLDIASIRLNAKKTGGVRAKAGSDECSPEQNTVHVYPKALGKHDRNSGEKPS